MATWRINISRRFYDEPIGMDEIRANLADVLVEDQADNFGHEGEFVVVPAMKVAEAVAVINSLGYETDGDDEDQG